MKKRKMNFIDFILYLMLQKRKTTIIELDNYLKSKNSTYKISTSKKIYTKKVFNLRK